MLIVDEDGCVIHVRLATEDDVLDLVRLYEQLAEDRPAARPATAAVARHLMPVIAGQAGRTLLVAVDGERVVGTADLVVVPNLTHGGDPWAIVENVVVDAVERRRGVGRILFAEIARRCDDAGCYKVQLLSRKHRDEAHAFYRSLGFEAVAEGFRRYTE